jgi:hypothetical protein
MSIINVKDLDYLLCLNLNQKDLLSFCSINKYYYSLYSNDYIWRKKLQKYNILCKKLDKDYYIELYKALHNEDFVLTVFLAICEERIDILDLLLREKQININYTFVFNKKYYNSHNSYYSSSPSNPNFPYFYSPISLIIKSGSYSMWNILKTYDINFDTSHYILAVVSKNIKILEDLLEYGINIDSSVLYFAIQSYNEEATILILKHVDLNCINSLLNNMIHNSSSSYLPWIQNHNSSFALFLKHPKVHPHMLFYRNLAFHDYDFIRLLSHY